MAPKATAASTLGTVDRDKRREARRERLWPGSASWAFRSDAGGFAQVPRTASFAANLVDLLGGDEKSGALYLTLWSYAWPGGMLEDVNPEDLVYEAGYGVRARGRPKRDRRQRTWDERIRILRRLGFVRTAPRGAIPDAHLLLVDPTRVILHHLSVPGTVPVAWENAFRQKCETFSINLDKIKPLAPEHESAPPPESARS